MIKPGADAEKLPDVAGPLTIEKVKTAGADPVQVSEVLSKLPARPLTEGVTISFAGQPPFVGVAVSVTGVPAEPDDRLNARVKLVAVDTDVEVPSNKSLVLKPKSFDD